MPLLPIDLQTAFSQLNQVGRDQALQQQAPPLAQAQAASQIVRQAQARDTQVNESRDAGDGVEAAKDEDAGKGKGRRRKARGREPQTPPAAKSVFKDPQLGQHIDITG